MMEQEHEDYGIAGKPHLPRVPKLEPLEELQSDFQPVLHQKRTQQQPVVEENLPPISKAYIRRMTDKDLRELLQDYKWKQRLPLLETNVWLFLWWKMRIGNF